MNIRKILIMLVISLLMVATDLNSQVIISPYNPRMVTLGEVGGTTGFGFWPFNNKNELQEVYDSERLNSTRSVSFSAIFRDSINAPTSYVDAISYIPDNGLFRLSLSIQLTKAEIEDSSLTKKDIALQRFLNKGGNIALSINRPIYYNELYSGNFLVSNTSLTAFFDVPFLNQEIYEPGAGIQLGADFDFRIFTNESLRQPGNIVRFGFRSKGVWNVVNEKYEIGSLEDKEFRNVAFFSIEPYFGLVFFDIKYSFIISGNEIFHQRKSVMEISIVPIKF